jgi:hypothetical protein
LISHIAERTLSPTYSLVSLRRGIALRQHLAVERADAQARQAVVVQHHVEVVPDPVHVDVGDDVDRVLAAERATRPRLEPADHRRCRRNRLDRDAERARDTAEVALDQRVELLVEDLQHERVVDPEHARLDREALAQVARGDAARIELLNRRERLEHDLFAHAALARDLVDRRGQVAAVVEVADDEARRDLLLDRQPGELELPEQVLAERLAARVGGVDRRGGRPG